LRVQGGIGLGRYHFKASKLVAELEFRSTTKQVGPIFKIKLVDRVLDRQRSLSKPTAH
jgi:hypothetical protein